MKHRAKKWAIASLRWSVAIVGIWYVLHAMWFRDHVTVVSDHQVLEVPLVEHQPDNAPNVKVWWPDGTQRDIPASQIIRKAADRERVITRDGAVYDVVGFQGEGDEIQAILVKPPPHSTAMWLDPKELKDQNYKPFSRPRIEPGIDSLVKFASPSSLWGAILIFPITFLITSYRWHELLKALDIHIGQARTFVLNMVGAFYNTFLLGSTGGDVVKAWYAARHTTHRTRAVMSVFVDRAIGLIALIMLGGGAAAYQYAFGLTNDPSRHALLKVAIASVIILAAIGGGLYVLLHPLLRKYTGLDFVMRKLPMQQQVQHAMEALHMYSRRPWLVLWTLIATFPVHITVVVSALLAGHAFHLHISEYYYFVAVPVIVLVGAIPISPQGAGVMEAFAFLLIKSQGANVSEAVVLTMSIRVVQILWNLTGGIFVLRGGYHAPTVAEQRDLQTDEDETSARSPAPQVSSV